MSKTWSRVSALAVLALSLGACAYPHTNVSSGSTRPALVLLGAPKNSVLYVDGVSMGDAAQFDGNRGALNVEEGLHRIVLEASGKTIHKEEFYVSTGERKTIDVGAR